jgi:RimJ/RimL family protein N-acetyltransferase
MNIFPDHRVKCTDKRGSPFEVGACGMQDGEALRAMYDAFYPLAESQGLPPADTNQRRKWIERLLATARNFVVWKDDKIIGHSALIADLQRGDSEYIIFVSQEFRNRGMGKALTAMALDTARSLGLRKVWLTVESYNFRAIKLYRGTGFVFVDQGERERTMIFDLS